MENSILTPDHQISIEDKTLQAKLDTLIEITQSKSRLAGPGLIHVALHNFSSSFVDSNNPDKDQDTRSGSTYEKFHAILSDNEQNFAETHAGYKADKKSLINTRETDFAILFVVAATLEKTERKIFLDNVKKIRQLLLTRRENFTNLIAEVITKRKHRNVAPQIKSSPFDYDSDHNNLERVERIVETALCLPKEFNEDNFLNAPKLKPDEAIQKVNDYRITK